MIKRNNVMKIVVDTSVILQDPNIIKRWSPNYQIVIPDIVFEEIKKIYYRKPHKRHLPEILETMYILVEKKFIKSDEYKNNLVISKAELQQFNISRVDYLLAQYALNLSKKYKNVVLATEDKALSRYCKGINVKSIGFFELAELINVNVTTSLEDIKPRETIDDYHKRGYVISLVTFALTTVLILLLVLNFDALLKIDEIWFSLLVLTFGIIMFYIRQKFRYPYGAAEVFFGLLNVWLAINNIVYPTSYLQITGGLYIIVRGLDNIMIGTKGTPIEPFLRWLS